MTLRQFVAAIPSARRPAARRFLIGAAGILMSAVNADVFAEEPVVTNVGHFQIPFDIETEPGQKAEGFAVLFGSQDGGSRWDQLQSVPAAQNAFMFAAPRDGRYSFAIRMTDAKGTVQPPAPNSAPELDVVVDTVAPDLKLELFESTPGQVVVNWTCTDAGASPESLTIEFSDGANGRWKTLRVPASLNGQTLVPVSVGSVAAVRATITDAAGNRAESASQMVSRTSSPAGNCVTAAPPQFLNNALGPSPFANKPAASQTVTPPKSSAGSSSAMPSNTAGAAAIPMISSGGNQPVKNSLASEHSQRPMVPAMPNGFSDPASQNVSAGSPLQAGESQLVNMHVFDVDYQVEDVGPSGVSAVELFVTENGGQEWFRYGNDADLRSPFAVDVKSEGTYGFAVRVRNGLGFAAAPPQPGQAPEIVVVVDESAPVVDFMQPTLKADGFGTMELAWRVQDRHVHASPIRLEYATTPTGPWTAVFDWQTDHGGYKWAIRPGTPANLYLRLLARDEAGNVGMSQTPQPVIVDLNKPVGRLLRVQTVSQPTSIRQ